MIRGLNYAFNIVKINKNTSLHRKPDNKGKFYISRSKRYQEADLQKVAT